MNPADTSNSASVLLAIASSVSFCLIEKSRKRTPSDPLWVPGHYQHLRIHFQAGLVHRRTVDFKPDFFLLNKKTDHATGLQKTIRAAHGQSVAAGQRIEDERQPRFYRAVDEQNPALSQIRKRRHSSHDNWMAIDVLVFDGLIQFIAKRISA